MKTVNIAVSIGFYEKILEQKPILPENVKLIVYEENPQVQGESLKISSFQSVFLFFSLSSPFRFFLSFPSLCLSIYIHLPIYLYLCLLSSLPFVCLFVCLFLLTFFLPFFILLISIFSLFLSYFSYFLFFFLSFFFFFFSFFLFFLSFLFFSFLFFFLYVYLFLFVSLFLCVLSFLSSSPLFSVFPPYFCSCKPVCLLFTLSLHSSYSHSLYLLHSCF